MSETRIILNPIGGAGDVLPFLEIGKELLRRNYTISFLGHPKFREQAKTLGFEFCQVGQLDDMRKPGLDPRLSKASMAWIPAMKWGTLGTLEETYTRIKDISQGFRTIVLAPGMSFAARIAREVLDIRLVTVHLEPMKFRSVYQSPILPPLFLPQWMPKFAKRFQYWCADRLALDPLLARQTNEFRKSVGLENRVSRLLREWWNSPDMVLGLFPDWFAPPQVDWPKNTRLIGFPIQLTQESELSTEVESFLRAGSPPIVFVNSSGGSDKREFFQTAVETCEHLGARGILLGGWRGHIPHHLPDSVAFFKFVPLYSLLKRSVAIVHRGGIGTSSLALAAGCPQLLLPVSFGQPDTSNRLKKLGVGKICKRIDAAIWSRTLSKFLQLHECKAACEKYARLMQSSTGITNCCNLIDELNRR